MRSLLKKFYSRKSVFDPTNNFSRIPQQLIEKFSGKKILNIGAGNEPLGDKVITIDRFTQADIRADACSLPVKTGSVDLALCIAVLEHLPEPAAAVAEIARILKPNGEVYIEIPFLQPYHESPGDYFRATRQGLEYWCRDFQKVGSGVCVGPGSAVAWLEIEYVKLWFGRIPILGLLAELLFRACFLPLKFLDQFLIGNPEAHITASAIYFHGKKVLKTIPRTPHER